MFFHKKKRMHTQLDIIAHYLYYVDRTGTRDVMQNLRHVLNINPEHRHEYELLIILLSAQGQHHLLDSLADEILYDVDIYTLTGPKKNSAPLAVVIAGVAPTVFEQRQHQGDPSVLSIRNKMKLVSKHTYDLLSADTLHRILSGFYDRRMNRDDVWEALEVMNQAEHIFPTDIWKIHSFAHRFDIQCPRVRTLVSYIDYEMPQ